jgi:hypothetical protein
VTCTWHIECADKKKDLNMVKSAIIALLLAGSEIGTVSTAAIAAERSFSN